jgi:hypothetical protein
MGIQFLGEARVCAKRIFAECLTFRAVGLVQREFVAWDSTKAAGWEVPAGYQSPLAG